MAAQPAAAGAQIEPDDPKVIHIVTLIDELARKNRQIDEKEAEIKALREANEALRRAAIARTLTAAAQPEASAEALAAGAALEIGNTPPAEVLLREQEQTAAQSLPSGVPEALEQRHQAAELAREQGALAVGRDGRAALAAYLRAVEYQPNETYAVLHRRPAPATRRFQCSDPQLPGGPGNRAEARGGGPEQRRAGSATCRSATKDRRRARAQGDLAAALASLPGERMAIGEQLAAADPSNTELAARPVGQPRQDRRRAQRAGRPGGGAGLPGEPGDRRAAGGGRPGQRRAGSATCRSATTRSATCARAGRPGGGARAPTRRASQIRSSWRRPTRATPSWQRDLSVSHERIGDVAARAGRPGRRAGGLPARWRSGAAGGGRPGQHGVAARPVGQPRQARRRAGARRATCRRRWRAYRRRLAIGSSWRPPTRATASGSATCRSATTGSATCGARRATWPAALAATGG